jgi:beta-phosphoglucomutase
VGADVAELVDAVDSKSTLSNKVLVRVQSSAMLWVKKFDLFLFDFDGLLVNTEELHFMAYRKMCQARGFDLRWSMAQFFAAAHFDASGLKEAIYREFPGLFQQEPRWEVLYGEKKTLYQRVLEEEKLELLPGVAHVLEAVQDKKRCVVTNSSLAQITLIRDKIALLNTIPVWFTRESYTEPKPHPECYLKAIGALGKAGDRVIGFEDSVRGLKALEGAGVATRVLICPPDHPQLKLGPFNPYFSSFDVITYLD